MYSLQATKYGFPLPGRPYYHIGLRLDPSPSSELTVKKIHVNGRRVRDFIVQNDGRAERKRVWTSGSEASILVRADWANGSTNRVEVACEDASGAPVTLTSESTAPDYGGYWDTRWKYYASTVLNESQGLARENEPVHLWLGLYHDRLTDPTREVRVVAIDSASGRPEEVVSQVYDVSAWTKRSDEHCQPTTSFGVAFMADVPAFTSKVYLIFYGNPDAPAPEYPTDLRVTGEGFGLTVENDHYKMILHPESGAIDEIHLKQGTNVVFAHHLETNGALHWNPCVYAPPRSWLHASDWQQPGGYTTIVGPVFCMTKRWAPLPDYPEVDCSVTYTFYRHTPYMMLETSMDVVKDLDVEALRNGEIVINQEVVDEFAWVRPDGDIDSVVIKDMPRHPTRALDISAWTRWWAFFSRDVPCALAAINLELTGIRRGHGPLQWEPYIYLHWGPWYYCARPLVYTFATPNPQRVMRVGEGSTFYERMAVYPCRLGQTDEDRFDPIEFASDRLFNPLVRTGTVLDIDERVPEEWVPPILVSEFEEMDE